MSANYSSVDWRDFLINTGERDFRKWKKILFTALLITVVKQRRSNYNEIGDWQWQVKAESLETKFCATAALSVKNPTSTALGSKPWIRVQDLATKTTCSLVDKHCRFGQTSCLYTQVLKWRPHRFHHKVSNYVLDYTTLEHIRFNVVFGAVCTANVDY